MRETLRLLALALLASGCPSTSLVQRCGEICGDKGVQRATLAECVCRPKPEMPATVPLNPVGC